MLGEVRVTRTSWQTGKMGGRHMSADDIPILTGAEVRQLSERHALVLAENGAPIIARLNRCIDGKLGRQLLIEQNQLRDRVANGRAQAIDPNARVVAALFEARRRGLAGDFGSEPS